MSNPIKTAAMNIGKLFYLLGEALTDACMNLYYHTITKHIINRTPQVRFSEEAAQKGYTSDIMEFNIGDDEEALRSIKNMGWDVENHLATGYAVTIHNKGERVKTIVVLYRKQPYSGMAIITNETASVIHASPNKACTIDFNE